MSTPEETDNHWVAYVTWKVMIDWKRAEIIEGRDNKDAQVPLFAYATGAPRILTRVQPGDMLWLLTAPRFKGISYYPSLNAMLKVDRVVNLECTGERPRSVPKYLWDAWTQHHQWNYVIIGDPKGSEYFPINNCYEKVIPALVSKSSFKDIDRKVSEGKYSAAGSYFQQIQKIPDGRKKKAAAALRDHVDELNKRPTIFISYRWGKKAPDVRDIVQRLVARGFNCWLDAGWMPQRWEDSGKTDQDLEELFRQLLKNAIQHCDGFLALKREDYDKSKWTVIEQAIADEKFGRDQHPLRFEPSLADLESLAQRKRFCKKLVKRFRAAGLMPREAAPRSKRAQNREATLDDLKLKT